MNECETLEMPVVATMLETGTPQAIALRKENVIESELKSIELNYRGLKIAGIDDTTGIKIVSDARKYCKKLRTTAERICKAGRQDAIAEQNRWLQAEKYVVDRIKAVETELTAEETRIEKLRETERLEAARKAKAEDDRLQAICNEFAQLGKLHTKDAIRQMLPGFIEALLVAARNEKAEKETAAQKLADEKRAADETIAALQKQIAELQAEMLAKLAPPQAARPMNTEPLLPNGNQNGTPSEKPATNGKNYRWYKPVAPDYSKLPLLPMPDMNGNAVPAIPAPNPEAKRLEADKAALHTFAKQVEVLKKYLPMVQSKKATELNDLIASQIEKFVLFINKKAEEL